MKKFLLSSVGLIGLFAGQSAIAADMPIKAPLLAPPPVWNWTGFYVGTHVGAQAGRTDFTDPYGPPIYGDFVRTPGFLAGGQIGYNWQAPGSSWVFGLEADASGITSDGTNTCFAVSSTFLSSDCHVRPSATASLTGRIGQALGPQGRTLVYAKGGLALVRNNLAITDGGNAGVGSGGPIGFFFANAVNYTRVGGTVGAGVEQALSPAWSLKFEYDYLRFGSVNVVTPTTATFPPPTIVAPSTTGVTQDLHQFKVGLNYRLGADPWARWPAAFAPSYSVKAPPSVGWAPGWEFEAGSRIGWSTGKFAWTIIQPSPISRLTYDNMKGPVSELFQRLDSPWNVFVKSNIGIGTARGNQNDEDWNGGGFTYGNTASQLRNGKFAYGTVDAGYDVLRGPGYKVGPFIGYNYFDQRTDTYGCTQIAAPPPATGCAPGTVAPTTLVGQQQSTWRSGRIGLSGETELFSGWRISGEVAYLPGVTMNGRDNHLLRQATTYFEQTGKGRGVQLESAVSYFVTEHWSLGVGGRYMAMWTTNASDQIFVVPNAGQVVSARFDTSRLSLFAQSTFKFDWTDGAKARY